MLDDVAKTGSPVVITKRGRPIAKLVPYIKPAKKRSLAGIILKEKESPLTTAEKWNSDTA